jgi:hypothetical protein
MTSRAPTVFVVAALTCLAGVIPSTPSWAHRPPDGGATCEARVLQVRLTPQVIRPYRLVGWLCMPPYPSTTVQLTVSGFTYDHHYWDLPFRADRYSYVRHAVAPDRRGNVRQRRGTAVFNIDRLGVGLSDRPPGDQVTIPAEAYVLHQVVQALRRGAVGGIAFTHVVGVGHSLGAAMLICESGTPAASTADSPCPGYGDLDALVLADYLHGVNAAAQVAIRASLHPAAADPNFISVHLPDGYLTTLPGARMADFYNAAYADPAVVRADERLKQTGTSGEMATLGTARDPRYSRSIAVPVLLVVGAEDWLACGLQLPCTGDASVRTREAPFYNPQLALGVIVVPMAGHDTNLHPNASDWYADAQAWIRTAPMPGC